MHSQADQCEECGLVIEGGRAGCRALFDDISGRNFSEAGYYRVHRMFVDAYCLQHPEDYCRSAKSFAAHLSGLCAIMENGASPAIGLAELRDWLDGARELDKPELPEFRGRMTIGDIRHMETPDEWSEAVHKWAHEVWIAYAAVHDIARLWLAAAIAKKR